jgi:hypothetical protein
MDTKPLVGTLIAAMLLFGSGCAKSDWIERTLVTVDVTGTWAGKVEGAEREVSIDLEQQGSMVNGVMRGGTTGAPTSNVRAITGTVAGDRLRFRTERSEIVGELTVSGDEMTGTVTRLNSGPRQIFIRRVDPSSPPASPPR